MIELCPMTLKEANAYVEQHHRHHGPVVGHKFSIGLSDGEKIVGVAIVGRPVARHLDDGWTLEVNRLCTDGTRNACSMLYSAAWRAARAMGYKRLVTYILDTENGASLRASGWKCVGKAGGFRWTGKRRRREKMSRRKDNPSRWRVWPKEKKTRKPADKRDTEELVRCKECCHLEITGCYGECGRGYLGIVRPDDYCSRGRRREKST